MSKTLSKTETDKSADTCSPERRDIARKKLIEAGLKIYSEVGFEAASTRALAAAAGVNIAAIPYYFQSKEGLYLAVIDHIVDHYRQGIQDGLANITRALNDVKTTSAQLRALLDDYMRLLIHFVLQESKERAYMSRIYIREQLDPTPGFQRLYDGFVRGMHETMSALLGRILGPHLPLSEIKLIAQTLLGQVATFKSSREAVLHNMGWKNYGEEGIAEIERVVMRQTDAILQLYIRKGDAQ